MCEDEARRYGQYARYLFALSREEGHEGLELFLNEMTEDEVKKLLTFMINAGGRLT